MKRWFGLLIMLLIASGFLAGCGGSAEPPSGIITAPTSTTSSAEVGTPPAPPTGAVVQPTDTTSSGGANTPIPLETTPVPTAVVTPPPISRQARFDYPQQMQVNKPAKVQFSLFVAGKAPPTPAGATTEPQPFQVPAHPGLTPYVSVNLVPTGADVTKAENKEPQALRDDFNIWRWEITAAEQQPVVLQLQIHVDYCLDKGQSCQDGQDVVWHHPAGGYTIPILPDNPLMVLLNQAQTSVGAAVGIWGGLIGSIASVVGIIGGMIPILQLLGIIKQAPPRS